MSQDLCSNMGVRRLKMVACREDAVLAAANLDRDFPQLVLGNDGLDLSHRMVSRWHAM